MKVHLRKKKSPSGTHSLFLHYYHGGKSVKEYLGIHISKKDADLKEKMLLAEKIRSQKELDFLHGNFGLVSPGRKKTDLFKFFASFNKTYGKKDFRRFDAALSDLKRFCGYVNEFDMVIEKNVRPLPASVITEDFCRKFWEYLFTKHRGATSFNYFKAFKRVLKEATRSRIFLENPADEVRSVNKTQDHITKEVLSVEEIELLPLTPCGDNEVRRAFLFACFTGIRGCDIRPLNWNRIDLGKSRLKIEQSKTEGQNFMPLSRTAVYLLGEEGKGLVFNLPSTTYVSAILKKWTQDAGIKKHITFHCARHSFITNLLDHGTDLKTASSAAGHTSTRHTERYTHINDRMKRKAVDSLPELSKMK